MARQSDISQSARARLQQFVLAMSLLGITSSCIAGDRGFGQYIAPGFSIPDNSPLGAQSSMQLPAFGAVAAMVVAVRFPLTPSTGAHTWCGDLVAVLSFTPDAGGPTRSQYLYNRIGASSELSTGDSSLLIGVLQFSDIYGGNIWQAAEAAGPEEAVFTGEYHASSRSPAFQYQPVSLAAVFGTSVPAGTWSLNISDHAAGNTGRIVQWSISPFIPSPGTGAITTLAPLAALRRRRPPNHVGRR